MRVAALALLSALAVTVIPLAANAVPNGPSLPTVGFGQDVELAVVGSSPNAEQRSRRPHAHHPYRYWGGPYRHFR